MKRRRSLTAAIATVLLTSLMLEGCIDITVKLPASEVSEAPAETQEIADDHETDPSEGGGKPWIDSDLKSNVTADTKTDPRDDYHLYANKEWILENTIPDGYKGWSHYIERTREVKKQCIELLKDESIDGHDAKLIRTLNVLLLDWDARDKTGVSEIEGTYKKLLAINSTGDIDSMFEDRKLLDDTMKFFVIGADTGFNDPEHYIVVVDTPSLLLNDSAEYVTRSDYGKMYYGLRKDIFVYIANRLGMSEEEAGKCFEEALNFETKLSDHIYTTQEQKKEDYIERINN